MTDNREAIVVSGELVQEICKAMFEALDDWPTEMTTEECLAAFFAANVYARQVLLDEIGETETLQ